MTKYIGCENAKSASAKLVEKGVTTYFRSDLEAQRYIINNREKKIAWFRKKNNRWVEMEYWF